MVTGCQALCILALVVTVHLMEFICIKKTASIYVEIIEMGFYK